MITYNNDVLSEIWDAKRLIREYVNVAHLVFRFYENSDLSFSNKIKLQRLASVMCAYMDIEYDVNDTVDIVKSLFARGFNNVLSKSELTQEDFFEITKRLRKMADLDNFGVESRWIINKERQSIFYTLLKYRVNVQKLMTTFSSFIEMTPGGSLARKSVVSLYNPKLIEANEIIDDILVDLLGQRFKQCFSIPELTEKYGCPSTSDSELLDWEIDNM